MVNDTDLTPEEQAALEPLLRWLATLIVRVARDEAAPVVLELPPYQQDRAA
jgi:hypothetical protein